MQDFLLKLWADSKLLCSCWSDLFHTAKLISVELWLPLVMHSCLFMCAMILLLFSWFNWKLRANSDGVLDMRWFPILLQGLAFEPEVLTVQQGQSLILDLALWKQVSMSRWPAVVRKNAARISSSSWFHFSMSKVLQLVLPSAEAEGSLFKSGFQSTYATAVLQKPRPMMTLDKQYMCRRWTSMQKPRTMITLVKQYMCRRWTTMAVHLRDINCLCIVIIVLCFCMAGSKGDMESMWRSSRATSQ